VAHRFFVLDIFLQKLFLSDRFCLPHKKGAVEIKTDRVVLVCKAYIFPAIKYAIETQFPNLEIYSCNLNELPVVLVRENDLIFVEMIPSESFLEYFSRWRNSLIREMWERIVGLYSESLEFYTEGFGVSPNDLPKHTVFYRRPGGKRVGDGVIRKIQELLD